MLLLLRLKAVMVTYQDVSPFFTKLIKTIEIIRSALPIQLKLFTTQIQFSGILEELN